MPKKPLPKRANLIADVKRHSQLAGMTDGEGSARLGRPINTPGLLRPDVVAMNPEQGVLLYDTSQPLVFDVVRPELLDLFVALVDASDAEIWRFAQRYGVLGVQSFWEPGFYAEELKQWRYWAARIRAVLSAASSLQRGETICSGDWALLEAPHVDLWTRVFAGHSDLSASEKRRYIERNCVKDVLNAGLEIARVRPSFSWFTATSGIAFTNVDHITGELTLAGVLALQVALACGRAEAIATCSGCHLPYLRRWHSPTGRGNYCDRCGIRAAWRDSKRRKRGQSTERAAVTSKERKRGRQ